MLESAVVLGIPFAIGALPGLLPARIPTRWRWIIALVLAALSAWAAIGLADTPHGFHLIPLTAFWFGLALGTGGLAIRTAWERRRP